MLPVELLTGARVEAEEVGVEGDGAAGGDGAGGVFGCGAGSRGVSTDV